MNLIVYWKIKEKNTEIAGSVERVKIPLFDGSNFNNWKFRMETLLEELEIIELVSVPYTDRVVILDTDSAEIKATKEAELKKLGKQDKKAKSQIVQHIPDSHLEYVKDAETAWEMWLNLHNTFERKGITSQLLLRKSLLTMKFVAPSQSMEAHFLKFYQTVRELRSTGANLKEMDIGCHLLLTIPSEYDTVVTAIETLTHSENLRLESLKMSML